MIIGHINARTVIISNLNVIHVINIDYQVNFKYPGNQLFLSQLIIFISPLSLM